MNKISNQEIMKELISCCGLRCDACEFFGKTCQGCCQVKGQTFWALELMPGKTCPLFQCAVNERGHSSCGECPEIPCKTFREMKDPNSTEEEHQRMLAVRVSLLKAQIS